MTWTLINSTGTGGGTNPTTPAINCLGADLFAVVTSAFAAGTGLSDSSGNTWSQIGPFASGSAKFVSIYYVHNPLVSASQTFKFNGGSVFAGLAVTAWSGSNAFDQTNHATAPAFAAASATVSNGGTTATYAVNDILTVSGGTFATAAQFKVTAVTSGSVTAVALQTAGAYTTTPANPAATTGGLGAGCTLTVTYNSTTTLSTGSITPSANNSLVIAGLGTDGGTAQTIGSGFTIQNNQPFVSSQNEGAAIAYLIQGTAAAVNPAWSWTTAANGVAIIASFTPFIPPAAIVAQTDGAKVTNLTGANSTTFVLAGGAYSFDAVVAGGGTIALQQLGPDSATWVNSFSPLSATSVQEPVFLPPGTYRFSGGAGTYSAAVQRVKFA